MKSLLRMVIIISCVAQAQYRYGTTAANFLEIGTSSNAVGMGEAYVSLADDAISAYWNPAGLANVKGFEFGLSSQEWVVGISDFAGNSWRPRFRAPAGYIAKWMAAPLAAAGFNLDSSINPSRWVNRKMEGDWMSVKQAIEGIGIIEVPWLTSVIGPACGPALSLFPFAISFCQSCQHESSMRNRFISRNIYSSRQRTYWVYPLDGHAKG